MSDSDTFQTQVVGMAPARAVRAAELEVDVLRYIKLVNTGVIRRD